MNSFIQEDGMGNTFDEEGYQFVEMKMEADEVNYPLGDVTNFDQYSDFKPPEEMQEDKKEVTEEELSSSEKKRAAKSRTESTRKRRMSIRGAAAEIKVPSSTAYNWHKKGSESLELDEDVEKGGTRGAVKMGRPVLLNDIHKDYLISLVNVKPSIVLDEMMGRLTTEFADLKISKSSLHEFVTEKCRISLKRVHFRSIERNSPQKIEERYQWVKQWEKTDLDFESNCVSIDKATFYINMKRSMTWPKKGECVVVVTPKTRAKITTIIGTISPYGVVNIKVKSLKVAGPSKKRKEVPGGSVVVGKGKSGTVTGHYFNFIAMTLDVMDKHELFKGHYLVMDNAPIHKHTNIRSYIESRGYGWVYLPPYSPELNPIELFWSVCKSKLKREALLEEKTLTSRIKVACNNVLISNLHGFCKYSVAKFSDCLEKRPI